VNQGDVLGDQDCLTVWGRTQPAGGGHVVPQRIIREVLGLEAEARWSIH
jgi:hypothetical protein